MSPRPARSRSSRTRRPRYVADVAAESSRKLVLFSHHQLVSVYDQR